MSMSSRLFLGRPDGPADLFQWITLLKITSSDELDQRVDVILERESKLGKKETVAFLNEFRQRVQHFTAEHDEVRYSYIAEFCAIANAANVHPIENRLKKNQVSVAIFDAPSPSSLAGPFWACVTGGKFRKLLEKAGEDLFEQVVVDLHPFTTISNKDSSKTKDTSDLGRIRKAYSHLPILSIHGYAPLGIIHPSYSIGDAFFVGSKSGSVFHNHPASSIYEKAKWPTLLKQQEIHEAIIKAIQQRPNDQSILTAFKNAVDSDEVISMLKQEAATFEGAYEPNKHAFSGVTREVDGLAEKLDAVEAALAERRREDELDPNPNRNNYIGVAQVLPRVTLGCICDKCRFLEEEERSTAVERDVIVYERSNGDKKAVLRTQRLCPYVGKKHTKWTPIDGIDDDLPWGPLPGINTVVQHGCRKEDAGRAKKRGLRGSAVCLNGHPGAAREFHQLFLQVLDDGRLTDSQGRVVNFKNTVIIMTSNIGASYLNDLPDDAETIPKETRELINGALRTTLPIEFVNRIDSITLFNRLTRADVRAIVSIRIAEVQKRLRANGRDITLQLSDAALDYLGSVGYSPIFGARPLNREIQTSLLNPLSKMILEECIRDGETARVDFDAPRNRLVVTPNHEPTVQMEQDDDDLDDDMDEDDVAIEEVDE